MSQRHRSRPQTRLLWAFFALPASEALCLPVVAVLVCCASREHPSGQTVNENGLLSLLRRQRHLQGWSWSKRTAQGAEEMGPSVSFEGSLIKATAFCLCRRLSYVVPYSHHAQTTWLFHRTAMGPKAEARWPRWSDGEETGHHFPTLLCEMASEVPT